MMRGTKRRSRLALFLLVAFAPAAAAQTAPRDSLAAASLLERGSLVRVTREAPRERQQGALLGADSLVTLWRSDGGGRWSVKAGDVFSVEVPVTQQAPRRHHRGALVGFLVGAIPTAVAAVALASSPDPACEDGPCLAPDLALVLGVPFTLLTTGVGALVDHAHAGRSSRERWKPVLLPVRTMPADTPPGSAR